MPRVFTATKNKGGKKKYKCEKCSKVIKAGEQYHFYTRYRAKNRSIRCTAHYPRASELTGSETLSTVYGVQESLQDAVSSASDGSDMVSALDDAYSEIDGLVSTLEEKISNVESAFEYGTPVLDTLNEYRDNAEAFRDSIDAAKSEAESLWDDFCAEDEPDEENEDERQTWENRRDEVMGEISTLIDGIDCQF